MYIKHLRLLWVLILVAAPTTLASSTQNKLHQILNQIQDVKKIIHQHQSQRSNLQNELQSTETAISKLSVSVQETERQLQQQQYTLEKLKAKQAADEHRLQKQRLLLKQQIRMNYLLGLNNGYLKSLLNQDNPAQINRMMMYYRYLNQSRLQLISHLRQNLILLNDNKQNIENHQHKLITLKKQQLNEQYQLSSQKQNRTQVLHSIDTQVQTNTQKLQELLNNKHSLEITIQKLQKKHTYDSNYISHHKGKFPWPTIGKIIEHYGDSIGNSQLKQNGVLISAPDGQAVYAIAPGRVVFANWLPGYGLLIIIDHGKGYMTLYGNTNALYKSSNEIVKPGDLIAMVGHSGGQKKPALYFALRYKGKAVNPKIWCGS
jgi:septal ring factor EnvC (AmiA/AmiB activator)